MSIRNFFKFRHLLINKRVTLFILCIFLIFSSFSVFSNSYSGIIFDNLEVHSDITGRVILESPTTQNLQIVMRLRNSNIQIISSINSTGHFKFNSSNVKNQGLYSFHIIDSNNGRFPHEGYVYKYINKNFNEFESAIKHLLSNDSLDSEFARPNNEIFDSGFILFHLSEILKQSYNYHYFDSQYSLQLILDLVNSSWSQDGGCSESNFNCSARNYQPTHGFYSAAQIQGEVIESLWKSYQLTQLEILKEYAINFSNSAPNPSSGDCNFISLNFNCINEKGQNAMINGYIQAYLGSGNVTYLDRAVEFGNIEIYDSDIEMIEPLVKLFELTKNETYLHRAYEIFRLVKDDCKLIACNVERFSEIVKSSLILFRHFEPFSSQWYEIQRWGLDSFLDENISNSCSEPINLNPSICRNSFTQFNLIRTYENLKNSFFNSGVNIYDIQISNTQLNEVNISFKKHSYLSNISLFIRDSQEVLEPFIEIPLDIYSNHVLINETIINTSSFYEFYFEFDLIDENTILRFPENSNYVIPISTEFIELEEKLSDIVTSNPLFFCNPFELNASFSCRFEYMQSNYISALSKYQLNIENNSLVNSALVGLSTSIIDPIGEDSTCDPLINDFNCESINPAFIANPLGKPSIFRATSLIEGYSDLYLLSRNSTHLSYAFEFANNPVWAEECNFKLNKFNCGEENVHQAVISYSKLFKITGDETYRDWIEELIIQSSNYQNSSLKYLSWLYFYDFLEQSQRDEILTYIETFSQNCLDFNCSIEEFYTFKSLIWKSYKYFQNEAIFDLGNALLSVRPLSAQNYCDPNAPVAIIDRNSCEFPNEQSLLISSYIYSLTNFVNLRAPDLNITLFFNSTSLNFNELVDVTCRIENIGNDVLENSIATLLTEQTVLAGDLVNPIIFLDTNSTIEFDYTLNLTYGGRNEIRCGISNFVGILDYNVTNIGKVTSFNLVSNLVSQVNNEFLINISNFYDFPLEDIILNFSNKNITFSSSNLVAKEGNDSFEVLIPFLNSNSNELISLNLNFSEDINLTSNINLTSDFGGFNNFNFSLLTLTNSLNTSYRYKDSFKLFENAVVNLSIINNKLVDLENISIYLNSNYSSLNEVSEIYNLSSPYINFINISPFNLNISENQVELRLEFIPLSNITDLEIFFESPTGLNFSQIIPINIDTDILQFNFSNAQGLFQSPTLVDYKLTNPTPFTFYNITIDSYFSNASLNLSEIIPPFTSTFFNETINFTIINSTQNISQLDFGQMNLLTNSNITLEVNNSSQISQIEFELEIKNPSQILYFDFNVETFNDTLIRFIINNQTDITSQIITCNTLFCPITQYSQPNEENNLTLLIELEYSMNSSSSISFNSINALSTYEIRNFTGNVTNISSLVIEFIEPFSSLNIGKTFTFLSQSNSAPININYSVLNTSIHGEDQFIFSRIQPPSTSSSPEGSGGGGGSVSSGTISNIFNQSDFDLGLNDDLIETSSNLELIQSFQYQRISVIDTFILSSSILELDKFSNESNLQFFLENSTQLNVNREVFSYLNSKSILQLNKDYINKLINTCLNIQKDVYINTSHSNLFLINTILENTCDFDIIDIYILESILSNYSMNLTIFKTNQTKVKFKNLFNQSMVHIDILASKSKITYSYDLNLELLFQANNIDYGNLTDSQKNALFGNIVTNNFSEASIITLDTNHLDFIENTYEDRFSQLRNILLLLTILFSSFMIRSILLILLIVSLTLSISYLINLIIIKRDQIYIFLFKKYLNRKRKIYESHLSTLSEHDSGSIIRSLNLKIIRVEQLISKSDILGAKKEFDDIVGLYNKEYHFLNLNRNQLHKAGFIFNKIKELEIFFRKNSITSSNSNLNLKTNDLQNSNNLQNDRMTKEHESENLSNQDILQENEFNVELKKSNSQHDDEKLLENDEEEEDNTEIEVFLQLNKIKILNKDLKLDEAEDLIRKIKRKVDQISDLKKFEKEYLLEKIGEVEKETQHLLDTSYSYKLSKFLEYIKESTLSKIGKKE
ncbi:MAG: hypothetical protein ACMXYB_02010 [Candidatus Woesearchaeota archaeon]